MIVSVQDERFWLNVAVQRVDDCWEWVGPLARTGYGKASVGGKSVAAHRYAYAAWNSVEIPSSVFVLHQCDNRKCVNPHHLRLGSHADNMREAAERGLMRHSGVTHCKHGHAFTPENTYEHRGSRYCRTCRDIRKAMVLAKPGYRERIRQQDNARRRRRTPEQVLKDRIKARERYLRQNPHRKHLAKTLEPVA